MDGGIRCVFADQRFHLGGRGYEAGEQMLLENASVLEARTSVTA